MLVFSRCILTVERSADQERSKSKEILFPDSFGLLFNHIFGNYKIYPSFSQHHTSVAIKAADRC